MESQSAELHNIETGPYESSSTRMITHSTQVSSFCGLVLLGTILLCTSCDQTAKPNGDSALGRSVRHDSLADSPIKLTVTVSNAKLRLSDELTLTLEVRKSDDYRFDFPPLESLLTDFTVIDSKSLLPKLDGEFELQQRVYQLQPNKAGKFELILPPISYFAASQSDGSESRPNQPENSKSAEPEENADQALGFVEVEPLEIEVISELSTQNPSLDNLRAQAEPLDLEKSPARYAVWIALGAAFIAIGSALVAIIASRRTKSALPRVSPREQALSELDRLVVSKLAEQDVKLYYVELTAIVRRYIEGTTGVRAPEQTTEEFLREVVEGQRFSAAIVSRLQAFLESADLVKFAGQTPNTNEVTHSQTTAREFILTELIASPTPQPLEVLSQNNQLDKATDQFSDQGASR